MSTLHYGLPSEIFNVRRKIFSRGDHLNNSVVHMHDQRNVTKGLFFEAERNSRELRLGVKMCLFMRKRVLLVSIKGHFGSFLKLHQTCPPKKGGKYGDKIVQN